MDTCSKNLEKFVDNEKYIRLIEDLHAIKNNEEAEKLEESFKRAVDPYQEQPELLDPYLADLIERLIAGLSDPNITSQRYHTIFKFLYQLIKVTGFKSIGKRFPHDTNRLILLINLLNKEDTQDKANWQTRFVLTVWLSIVILTPFDLAKFDSESSDQSTAEKIYVTLIRSLSLHDSCQHVTAYCLAKFFSRPDILKSDNLISSFFSLALKELANIKTGKTNSIDDIPLIGYLRTLAYTLKFAPREEIKSRCKTIIGVVINLDVVKIDRELVNHLIIKLLQRAGLALLPKRLASWRYKRVSRILGSSNTNNLATDLSPNNNEDEIIATNDLESILGIMFVAAQNAQTRIRYSAAKGIARLSSRLSREKASDVIDMLISSFFDPVSSNEFAWHGGCLIFAEMARNGLILEEKLGEITRIVSQAIIYDKIKGSFAVGAHVRESACYVFWAMARTYEDSLLEPYISSISIQLLRTILFDRELQCRRAASATFQELIGRQGTFTEEDIKIMTTVDYQNVGPRQFAYLHLALQVAEFGPKYSVPFVEHLLEKKICHWDIQIRRLASDSLSALMLHCEQTFVRETVLPQLMKISDQDSDNNAKHGAMLALAKVIRGLVPLQFVFSSDLVTFVGQIVDKCQKQLKSKPLAANFIEAIGLMITSAEVASFSYADDSTTIKQWQSIALDALNSDNASLRDIGSEALLKLYRTYYKGNKACQDSILTILNKSLKSFNESSRCGALRALSRLGELTRAANTNETNSIMLDADTPDIILISLISYISSETREQEQDIVYAEAKAEACGAFVNFIRSLDKSRLIVSTSLLVAGYEALIGKTMDYTFDKRGDIGVVVRRAAVKALQDLTLYLLSIELKSLFDPERVTKIMGRVLQQAVSYNNSAREQAALTFYKLIGSNLPDNTIAHKDYILKLLERFQVNDEFNWRDDSTPIFVNLLGKSDYGGDIWVGLLPSVGQVSDMCAQQFRKALRNYLQELASNESLESQLERKQVFDVFMDTLQRTDMPDRLVTSGLIVADYLLIEGLMYETSSDFQERLVSFCWGLRASNDPKRLASISRVLSSMLQFDGPIQLTCLKYCLILLANNYPKVRMHTAEQLYMSIMTYQTDLEESLGGKTAAAAEAEAESRAPELGDSTGADEKAEAEGFRQSMGAQSSKLDLDRAQELLSETNWGEPLEKVRQVRNQVCACLMVDPSSLCSL